MQRNHNDGNEEHQLDVDDLKGMNRSHGEHSRLFVFVVHLVEVLVEEGRVIGAVDPVRDVVLVQENNGNLQEQPPPAVLQPLVVESQPGSTVISVG